MIPSLRKFLRAVLLLSWTLILFGPLVLASLCPGSELKKYQRRAAVIRRWARGMAWGMGMRIQVIGQPPSPPFIFVSNHLGYVDIILLAATCPAYFISRGDVRNWPLIGPIVRRSNIIFINRELKRDIPRVRALMKQYYDMGAGLIFFPEATSTQGAEILPFKPSLLDLPASEQIPVFCGVLHYATPGDQPPAQESICWWGDMEFAPHISDLLRLPHFDAKVTFLEQSNGATDRKVLAKELHAKIAANFSPVK